MRREKEKKNNIHDCFVGYRIASSSQITILKIAFRVHTYFKSNVTEQRDV